MYLNFQQMFDAVAHLPEVRFRQESIDGVHVTIVAYMVSSDDTWAAPLGLETRGITFDTGTGELLSLPFEKFFNVGEKAHTQPHIVAKEMEDGPFYVAEKRDGSMITPVLINNKVILKTKKSAFSDVAIEANHAATPEFLDFCRFMMEKDLCPIFEFTSPDSKIVVNYGLAPEFYLLAARCMQTGQYLNYSSLQTIAAEHGISVVPAWPYKDLQSILEAADTVEGMEGWVIYTSNGRYKVKTEWYKRRHHLIDVRERDIASYVLSEELDDLMQDLEAHGAEMDTVRKIATAVTSHLKILYNDALELGRQAAAFTGAERAEWVVANAGILQKIVFRLAKDPNWEKLDDAIKDIYRGNYLKEFSLRSIGNPNFRKVDDES